MLIYFTDAITEQQVAVNPKYVTVVFTAHEGEMSGKTIITLVNGNIVVTQSLIDVVGALQAQLQ
jgi:hypothetical protein